MPDEVSYLPPPPMGKNAKYSKPHRPNPAFSSSTIQPKHEPESKFESEDDSVSYKLAEFINFIGKCELPDAKVHATPYKEDRHNGRVWLITICSYTQHSQDGPCKHVEETQGFVYNVKENVDFRRKLLARETELDIKIDRGEIKKADYSFYVQGKIFDENDRVTFVLNKAPRKTDEKQAFYCTLNGEHVSLFKTGNGC